MSFDKMSNKLELDKTKFMNRLDSWINKSPNERLRTISDNQKDFIKKKGEEFFYLLKELENKGLLKNLTSEEIVSTNKIYERITKNIEEISKLTMVFNDMVINNNNPSEQGEEILLKDNQNKNYHISAHQMIVQMGINYSMYCEFFKLWLIGIIDVTKFKKITGIGDLKKELKNEDIPTDFFDNIHDSNIKDVSLIDNKLRNAFFHLKFELNNERLYYGNQQLELKYFLKLNMCADRTALVCMYGCYYYFGMKQILC